MTLSALSAKTATYLEPDEVKQIERAYSFAEAAHEGQTRQSGDPYITHPLAVAHILADMRMDHECLEAALLHDVIEDTPVTKQQIADEFSPTVAELVDGVSKMEAPLSTSREHRQAENFLKLSMAMTRDIRVVLVKMADRLHNMRTLSVLSPAKKRRIAKETLDIYAPIAQRLGINNFRIEFEDLGFMAMYPMRHYLMRKALEKARKNRKHYVDEIQLLLEKRLARSEIDATVIGREKHLWSIYRKMKNKHKSFKEIMDVFAFRIITHSLDDCYRVLGIVHNVFKPVAGEFKDYIAIPKSNGYQSLHTDVIGTHGVPIEVQIRTSEMDTVADKGIAAHWLYKHGEDRLQRSHQSANRWIKTLVELQQQSGSSMEYIEHVKSDLFPDEIYVFTPKGQIIELPRNATAVDFAYAVHTDVGNSCVACEINGQMHYPISQPLQSGQKVRIVTIRDSQPNPSWLNFVVTGKARSAIHHFLKNQQHDQSVDLGRNLLDKALQRYGTGYYSLKKSQIKHLINSTSASSLEQILQEIGLGTRVAFAVANILVPEEQRPEIVSETAHPAIVVDTGDGLNIQFAKCCSPMPGEEIGGHISPGRGLIVHLTTCRNLDEIRHNPERYMPLRWSDNPMGEFQVSLRMEVEQESDLISSVAATVTKHEASLSEIRMVEKDGMSCQIFMTIGVLDRLHLANLMRSLKKIPTCKHLTRIKNSGANR